MKIGKSMNKLRISGISVMDRYIFNELVVPFLFGMGLFTSLTLSIGTLFDLVRQVTESGLLLSIAIQVLLLKMPGFMVLAFPMSVLLATLMAYSRLSGDSELIALRSIGVSVYRLIVPGLVFSLLITGITFSFNNFIAPATNFQASVTLEKALETTKPAFRERNFIYREYQEVKQPNGEKETILARLFYAQEFDGKKMTGLTVLDLSQKGVNQILISESASWNFAENTWDVSNGTIYLVSPDGSYENIIRFEHQKLSLPREPIDLAQKDRDYNEMSIFQAQEYLKLLEAGGDDRRIRKLRVRIQEKVALPFVCFVFGAIGISLGLKPQNTGRATSFGICVVLIFTYYLLSFITSSLGIREILSPFMAAWLPNLLGLSAAGVLLANSSK